MQRILLALAVSGVLLVLGGLQRPATAADKPMVTVNPIGPPTAAAGLRVQWTAAGKLGLNQYAQYDGWVVIEREALATQWVSLQNQGSLDDTAVQQGQTYRYRACVLLNNPPDDVPRACSDWVSAQASNGGSAGGTTSSSLMTLPAELPTDVKATGITDTGATITWQAIPGETAYEITSADESDLQGTSRTGSATGTSYTVTALSPGHNYMVTVCGKSTNGSGASSSRSCASLYFQTQEISISSNSVLPSRCAACAVIEATLPAQVTPTPIPISINEVSTSSVLPSRCAACAVIESTVPQPQSSPPASQPPAYHDPSIVNGWPQLDLRTQGEAVKSLQYLLLARGGTLPSFGVDGKFGLETDAAVRAFQKAQGLTVDGIVGPNTWRALIMTVQQGSQGPAVKAVQSQLASRGTAIVVDGDFGAQTDAAVKAYQQSHQQSDGLPVDGQVGPQTWPVLLSGK